MVDARLPDGSRVNAVVPPIALDGVAADDPEVRCRPLHRSGPDLLRHDDASGPRLPRGLRARSPQHHHFRRHRLGQDHDAQRAELLPARRTSASSPSRTPPSSSSIRTTCSGWSRARPTSRAAAQIAIRELVRNSLRMRPDRIIVGEVRDGAALDMLQAMNTGHDGSLTTVHANSPRDSLSRLETMVLMAGVELPVRAIREQVAGAIDLIVQQSRLKDGSRRIVAITEVVGMESDVITLQDIFTFDYSAGRDEAGRYRGALVPTGIRPEVHPGPRRLGSRPAQPAFREAGTVILFVRRLMAALAGGAVLLLLAPPSAMAAVDASLSDVKSTAAGVTGVLTFRSANPVQVDAATLVASVDETPIEVAITKSTHIERTAMLVIDTSGSMGASGMSTVRSATRAYLKEAPPDVLIGVVTFANTAGVDLKPTADRAAVQRVVDGLDARGDTSLYAAVKAATGALPANGDRSIVLLSDGADTVSKNRQRDLAAAVPGIEAARRTCRRCPLQHGRPRCCGALRGFAGANGGSVISAKNTKDVGAAFQSAARRSDLRSSSRSSQAQPLRGSHTISISGKAGTSRSRPPSDQLRCSASARLVQRQPPASPRMRRLQPFVLLRCSTR